MMKGEPVKMIHENPTAIWYPPQWPKPSGSEVKSYYLSEEELARYRALPKPGPKAYDLSTTAPQSSKGRTYARYGKKGGETL